MMIVVLRRLALVSVVALVLTACSSTGSSAPPDAIASPDAQGSPVATRIEVALTDTLAMDPAAMSVPAGVPITFVVTNTGSTDHEFYLGDEGAQADHGKEMSATGGMGHDEPAGIGLTPGETKELTYTFAMPGATLAGCHVAGHYGAGMKAMITVTE